MTETVSHATPLAVSQTLGRVVAVHDGVCEVEVGANRSPAQRAAGCLLEPAVGDDVLLALVEDGRTYVLTVLERTSGRFAIEVDGDLSIAPQGGLRLEPQGDLAMCTPAGVSLTTSRVDVAALEAKVVVERAVHLGASLVSEVAAFKRVAETVDRTLGRVVERVKRSYRWVEETDHLRADSLDYRATTMAKVHGANTLVTSEQLVKIDSAQIHIG